MRYVVGSFLMLVLCGCPSIFSSHQQGETTPTPQPRDMSEVYRLLLSDLQPLCALETAGKDLTRVACQVVRRTEEGEVPLLTPPEGIRFDWQPPGRVSGAEIVVEKTQMALDGLTFEAEIRISGSASAQLRFELLATPAQGEAQKKSQLVSLPYSVETFGQLTTHDTFFQAGGGAGKPELRLPARRIRPAEMLLSLGVRQTQPHCRLRDTLYVAGREHVYSFHGGRYRRLPVRPLGASPGRDLAAVPEPAIGFFPALACFQGATPADDRLFIASLPKRASGLQRFTVARLAADGRGESWTSPEKLTVRNIGGAAAGADGTLYLFSADDDKPRIYSVSPQGAFSLVANVRLPAGLTFAPPRPTPEWQGLYAGALALAPNGEFWITLARANAVLAVKRDGSSRPLTRTPRSEDLDTPLGIAVHPSGDALVADHYHKRIARIAVATGTVFTHLGGPREAPLLGSGEVGADGISPEEPVGLFTTGNVFYLSYEPAEMTASGHLAIVHQDGAGSPFTWLTLLGGPLPMLAEGGRLEEAASGTGGHFVGLLGTARYRAGNLCFVERAPWRLACVVTDAQGVRRLKEVVAGPEAPADQARALVPVDSRQVGLSSLYGFDSGAGGIFVAQQQPPLLHRVYWNSSLKRYERVTIAGTGNRGRTAEAADALEANLLRPYAVAVHPNGSIYFSEYWDQGGGNDSRIRRLVPIPGGKYRLETVAGNGVRGAPQVGAAPLSSPLHWTTDMAFDPKGRLVIAQNCWGSCGGLYRLAENGTWERLAGGGAGTGDSGPALGLRLRPRQLAFGPGEEIFFVDSSFELRRLYRPAADQPLRVETLRARDGNAERCAGGAVAGTTFLPSLGGVCAGDIWSVAAVDRCRSQGYTEIALMENHAEDSVQSLLVLARRPCR